jgi:hypothetical protein
MSGQPGFDRLRQRTPGDPVRRRRPTRAPDPLGRQSLYSVAEQPPALGAVSVECSSCGQTSVVTPRALLRLAVPSVHLPLLKGRHFSWLRCPACDRRTWVRLGLSV